MNYRHAIFDLDGTLLDTIADLADAMNHVLAGMGHPGHPVDSYKYFVGDGMKNLAARSLPKNSRSEASIDECAKRMSEWYGERWAVKTAPYKGISKTLAELSLRGVRMAVFSNKPDPITKVVVAKFFPDIPFTHIMGMSDAFPKKPDPKGVLSIASSWGVTPEKVFYLGDTDTDMRTAVSAGMFAAGALWGFRTGAELESNGAVALLTAPEEILPFFD